jgi:AP-2 complex subunit alpha
MTLVVNSMRNDLIGQLIHGQTLALAAVSNIGGNDLAEALAGDVQRLILGTMETKQFNNVAISAEEEVRNKSLVCKKATLCLLRLYRTNPDCLVADEWMKRLARLLEDRDLGVVTSVMSLLLGLASSNPAFFEPLVPYVISILNRLVVTRSCSADYLYYRTPSPWLQVKCLRLLQYYKMPAEKNQSELLNEILGNILIKTEVSESQNKSNADHSVLFEAINLVIMYAGDAASYLKDQVCTLLGRFIAVKDPNIRYLGLDAMTRMAKLDGPEVVQMHQSTVLDSLKDTDISVRKRALNLLYVLTDRNNAQVIVSDLLQHLGEAESAMKEDIVVKIAILAEKFSADLHWYVNTMVQVILVAGDFVAEAVWYRVVQIVINNASIHEYAAEKMLVTVESKYAHDNAVAIAAYLLGEIGVNICEHPGMSGYDQFVALNQHMPNCSLKVQCILLTTYMKLLNLYPEQTSEQITEVFRKYSTSCHLELQQRACEYLALPGIAADTMEAVLNPMPPFEIDNKESALLGLSVGSSRNAGANADKVAAGGSASFSTAGEHAAEKSPAAKEIAAVQKVSPHGPVLIVFRCS